MQKVTTRSVFAAAAALGVAALCAHVPSARAATFFPRIDTKAAIVTVGGTPYIYVATLTAPGGGTTGNVFLTKAASPYNWTQLFNVPAGVTFMAQTGVAVADAPSGAWGGPRVFLIGQVGTNPATLWEYATSTSTWQDLGVPSATPYFASFNNNPTIDAIYYGGSVAVAVNTTTDGDPGAGSTIGHPYTCLRSGPGSACTWRDISGVAGVAASTSNIAWNAATVPVTDLELYFVNTSHRLQRYLYNANTAPNMPGAPAGYVAEWNGTRISPISTATETRVAIAVYDGTGSGDDIYEAKITSSNSWSWYTLAPSGTSLRWLGYQPNNLHRQAGGVYENIAGVANGSTIVYDCIPAGLINPCPPVHGSSAHPLPADLKVGRDHFGSSLLLHVTSGGTRAAFVPGMFQNTGGTATYVYRADLAATKWANWLAPRDRMSPFPNITGPNVFLGDEFSADEYYGSVAAIGTGGGLVWRSVDDGNSWVAGADPFTLAPAGGNADSNLTFGPTGTLYVAAMTSCVVIGLEIQCAVGIARETSLTNFTTPTAIPATVVSFLGSNYYFVGDRPWLAGDRVGGSDFLVVTYHGDSRGPGGRLTYCRGPGTCDNAAAWCPTLAPAYPMPADCAGTPGSSCQVLSGGDGSYWIVMENDAACLPAPGRPDTQYRSSVRRITNLTAMRAGCVPPTWNATPDACVFYNTAVDGTAVQLHKGAVAGTSCSPTIPCPSGQHCQASVCVADIWNDTERRWGLRAVAAPDASGDFGILALVSRDIRGGGVVDCWTDNGACTSDANCATSDMCNLTTGRCETRQCRFDQGFLRWRAASGAFCTNGVCSGPSGHLYGSQNDGIDINTDSTGSLWNDHLVPVVALTDDGGYGFFAHDYRQDTQNAHYQLSVRTLQYGGSSLGPATDAAELFTVPGTNPSPYCYAEGDIDQAASWHLHGHFITRYIRHPTCSVFPGTTTDQGVLTWSPNSLP